MRHVTAALLVFALTNCSANNETPQDESGSSAGVGGMPATGGTGAVSATGGGNTVGGTGGSSGGTVGGDGAGASAGGGTGGDSGSAGTGAAGSGGNSGTPGPILPPVDNVDDNGPFTTTIDRNAGPGGTAWVARPTELGQGGLKHPIFLWGPGAGTAPSNYETYLTHWASHGFVVYSIVSTGDGSEMVAGIDWLVSQNATSDSPLFGKLDANRIAAGGHSRGSLSAFGAASDPRLTTTIHVAGGSFDGNGPSKLHAPAAYICGETDTLATPNCERDYQGTTVPVFFTVMQGVDHIRATQFGKPAVTAWLRWHLGGEAERRAMFLDPSCTFCTAPWVSQSKNW
jgi:hypothetical protein